MVFVVSLCAMLYALCSPLIAMRFAYFTLHLKPYALRPAVFIAMRYALCALLMKRGFLWILL
jgi:hypothetical protein